MEENHPTTEPRKFSHAETVFNKYKIKTAVNMEISDVGNTGHVVLPGTPVTDILPATRLLVINIPDGNTIKSTHACKLEILWLYDEAKYHI